MAKLKMEKLLEKPEGLSTLDRAAFGAWVDLKRVNARTRMVEALENVGLVVEIHENIWSGMSATMETGSAKTHIRIETERLDSWRSGSNIYFNIGDPRIDHYRSIRRKERKGGMFPFEAVSAEVKKMLVDAEKYNQNTMAQEDRKVRAQARADCKLKFLREKHGLEKHLAIEITSKDGEVYGLKMDIAGLSQVQLESLISKINPQ